MARGLTAFLWCTDQHHYFYRSVQAMIYVDLENSIHLYLLFSSEKNGDLLATFEKDKQTNE